MFDLRKILEGAVTNARQPKPVATTKAMSYQEKMARERQANPIAFDKKYTTSTSRPVAQPIDYRKDEYGKSNFLERLMNPAAIENRAKIREQNKANSELFRTNPVQARLNIQDTIKLADENSNQSRIDTANINSSNFLHNMSTAGSKVLGEGLGNLAFGADQTPDKLDIKDVGRFIVNLPGGMASVATSTPSNISRAITGKGIDEYGQKQDLTGWQRAGSGLTAGIDVVGTFLGGSGTLLKGVLQKSGKEILKQGGKQGIKQLFKKLGMDAGEEALEEGAQYVTGILSRDGNLDNFDPLELGKTMALGAAGGLVMSGGGKVIGSAKTGGRNLANKVTTNLVTNKQSNLIAGNPKIIAPNYNTDMNEAFTMNDYVAYKNPSDPYLKGWKPGDFNAINNLSEDIRTIGRKADMDFITGTPAEIKQRNDMYQAGRQEAIAERNRPVETKVRQLTPEQIKQQKIDDKKNKSQTGSIANPFYTGDKTKVTVKQNNRSTDAAREALLQKSLDQQFRYSDGIMTRRAKLEKDIASKNITSFESKEVPKYEYNRTKYNRMNQREQDAFDIKMKEKKTIYIANNKDGSYMEVPKSVHDYYKNKLSDKPNPMSINQDMPQSSRENSIIPRVGDTELPINKDITIGDNTPIKKGNSRPDILTTVSGRKIQLDQYNPKGKDPSAKWNSTLIDAAIEEAKLRNDSMNLGIFEDMKGRSYKNISESDLSGLHQYLFDSPDSVKLTYGNKPTTPTPQVSKTDPLESIRAEARKYKSADEFIRSQGGDQLAAKPDAVQFDSKSIEAFRNQYFEKPNSKKIFNNREQTINGMKQLWADANKPTSVVSKTDPVAKYGWTSKETPKGTELTNRNGKVVAIITTKNGRNVATHPDGTKIASAGGSKDAFAKEVATKYYYASEVKPTPTITKNAPTELPIVGKPIANRKVVEPSIAPSTKEVSVVKPPKSQPKLKKEVQSSTPIIAEKLMLQQGQLPTVTPTKAKQIFKETKNVYPFEKVLSEGKKPINLPDNSRLLDTDKVKADVAANLQTKADNFERMVYGDTTSDIKGGTKGANLYQQQIRKGKEAYNTAIEKGLSSEKGIVRNISRGIRTLFGSAGDTAKRISKKGEFRGGIDESINLANDFKKLGDTMLPDKASQERVWAVLDPELAGTKIDESSLTPQETKALQTIRQASDLINDTNFAMDKISHETWLKGKDGKYLTRAYEEFDIPTELKDSQAFVAGKGKLETGQYMQRKDVDEWKQANAIKDPFYLASKRIQSTMRNKSITDYADWINRQADMVSDTPKKGYTQLSDSKMWGELSGKNVRHDVLTDMKGFYSDSKALQGIYDGLNAYDKFAPRQLLKSTKTVLNPATRLGNQTSNRVFAAMNGVNLAKFEWNMHKFAPQELAKNGKYARMLRKEGILGTDMTKYELAKTLVKDGVEQGKISKAFDKVKSSYGAADDKAKLSAFKYWLDKGKTVDEAILKVRNGFQDYSKVGLLYDVAAKTPLVGKSFIRFQSELARIIKNSATENPLSLATVVGSIALIGNLASKASGETPEDKETREGRFGTPVIPFTQIPLVFQTPIGEINVARMFGMYETAGADTKNKNLVQRASKYLPFDVPTNKDDVIKSLGNDVLLGPIANQFTDTDFRGKSISDPDSNKYQESTLTDAEKAANRAGTAYRSYQLPVVNDVENIGRAALGLKDQYGKEKTVPQAASKLLGFKVEQFGTEQAQAQREKDAVYADYDKKDLKKQINSVLKDQAEGKIDANTAQKRIDSLNKKAGATQSNVKQSGKIFTNPNGGFSYLDDNGDLQTAKTEQLAELAIKKSEFEKTDKNIEIVGDKVLRKDKDGKAYTTSKADYDYQIGTAKLSQLKRSGNVNSWLKEANNQLALLDKQLNDPNTDPLDAIELLNKADTLQESIEKYTEYGGFTKPKAARKTKSNTRLDYTKGVESSYSDMVKNRNAVRNLLSNISIKRRKI
jgi:hypothetical protein